MNLKIVTVLLLSLGLFVAQSEGRSKRVNQIPNGNVFRCANCHIDPSGGGARTSFGEVVRQNYLDAGGNVIWNQALAQNDADGDGVTNGQELLDPNGTWTMGASNPGEATLVSNPGDPNSVTSVEQLIAAAMPASHKLDQNYPNPFNPTTTINFHVGQRSNVQIRIINSLGQVVRTLVSSRFEAGEYKVEWNGLDENGQDIPSGLYLYRMDADGFSQTRRMMLLK